MSSKEVDVDSVTDLFSKTKLIQESGVSFAGKSLKLDSESDAKEVIDAILECKTLTYLNLEGNTLGIDAAKGIAKALESHPEFKRALWKDLFTGRLKEEIPEALRYLGSGLMLSGATLSELNLSDNAFGPIGVEGLASLLKSPCCYALRELRLNNNGLGVTGGKLLAKALMSCYEDSKALNKPLALKVFIAGRNRLENEGTKALSLVFKTLQSLEEIQMPQNGIYHIGITALADAFQYNKNLKVIDLNDNTVSKKGSIAIAEVLPKLQSLICLNLGDCLLRTSGALSIAAALSGGHEHLEEVHLACNEISKKGGLVIAEALSNKKHLTKIVLDGNQFGDAVEEIKSKIVSISKNTVVSISDDEGSEDEEEVSGGEDDENISEEEQEEDEYEENEKVNKENVIEQKDKVTVDDFLNNPTPEKFVALDSNRAFLIIEEIKKQPEDNYLESLVSSLMKVSGLTTSNITNVQSLALDCSNSLYQELFSWASSQDQLMLVNNALLVHLGLLKSEDKKFKVIYNTEGCKIALQHAMKQNYFPDMSRNTIKVFVERKIEKNVTTITL